MLLTIAIPTYNRAKYLQETLDRLIAQLPVNPSGRLEILVSDNASTDGTGELCRNLMEISPGVMRYLRQLDNQGFDRNLDLLFANAKGRFVLLLGDDDYPMPGALDRLGYMLGETNDSEPGVIYCYHELIDGVTGDLRSLDERFFRSPNQNDSRLIRYNSGIDLMRQIDAPLHGGLTGTVFLRAAWLAADRECFIGTNFLHLAVAYQVAARHPIWVDYLPSFVVRVFKDHRWPANGELYFGLLKAGRPLQEFYPSDLIARLRRGNDWAVRRAIILYRAAAGEDRQLVRIMKDSLDKGRLGYWLLDLPLLLVPSHLLSLLLRLGLIFGWGKS